MRFTLCLVGLSLIVLSTTAQTKEETTEVTEQLEDVVVTGTMRESGKLNSPVPVEVYNAAYFKSNPVTNLFDAVGLINGVRPQVNCNICNTGDIHINGLEGPYTMVLIDGMPIVSGLGTVYGLYGIPQAMIERVEVVKGPAATLYGSEAVAGLINIITQKPERATKLSAELMGTSWREINADLAWKQNVGKHIQLLTGINYFNYTLPIDRNNDGFTDLTLQHRISTFSKWNIRRPENRIFNLGFRYVYEDRWGGQTWWRPQYRGSELVYGESIFTQRWEALGQYQLPLREMMILQFSANGHYQNSAYGTTIYKALQNIFFAQWLWYKNLKNHQLLTGASLRYTFFDDNTPATEVQFPQGIANRPDETFLPGIFLQDEVTIDEHNTLLLGIRYDYNSIHGKIWTPRLNYKWNSDANKDVIRISIGSGYRIANIYTEDHAALTGAREIIFKDHLRPERSWNINVNYVRKFYFNNGFISMDATAFYTYFNNKILPDYDSNPTQIIYSNLDEYAISKGLSANLQWTSNWGLQANIGATLLDVYSKEENFKQRQYFTERFSGIWNISYKMPGSRWSLDYTGNVYSPMKLPLINELDPRPGNSPWYSIQNIQLGYVLNSNLEIFGGVKNLLNWTPAKAAPFIIARAHDPFNKDVVIDTDGRILPTPENPYGLVFDPAYVYASNQGIRIFGGIKIKI